MKLVNAAQMTEIDRRAQEEYGIPALVLMESAGLFAWQALERIRATLHGSEGKPTLCVLAGKGNNGGDALVMARYACGAGWPVTVVLAAPEEELGEQAGLHAAVARRLRVPTFVWPAEQKHARDALARADLIVDGLAGTGIKGALRAPLDEMTAAANDAQAPVVAVDTPSGLSDAWEADMPAVRATWTLTMGLPKNVFYGPLSRPYCGSIIPIAVSFPRSLLEDPAIPGELLAEDDLPRLVPPLRPSSYKHRRGVVAVFAGAEGTTGAAVLSAEGAQRCRAGLVTIYADRAVYPLVAPNVRSIMVRPLEAESDEVPALARDAGAAVIGPGWGVVGREKLLRALIDALPGGAIDADGLNLIASLDHWPTMSVNWVLTPHPGELSRLLGRPTPEVMAGLTNAARELAERSGAVVVGKSSTVVVAHPDGRYAVVDGGNPALGTGGTGDVLAGAIAGLVAGGMDGWQAARAAVLAHQLAGRALREQNGTFLAEELPLELGRVVDGRKTGW